LAPVKVMKISGACSKLFAEYNLLSARIPLRGGGQLLAAG
jgi:hypothetical protein